MSGGFSATDAAATAVLVAPDAVIAQPDGLLLERVADEAKHTESLFTEHRTAAPGIKPTDPLWGDEGSVAANGYGYGGYGQNPPEIINFIGVKVGGTWVFTGTVIDDEEVAGLTVTFGGLLAGHTATVQVDGTFVFAHVFPPNTVGVVTAVVTDLDGLLSEQEQCGVW